MEQDGAINVKRIIKKVDRRLIPVLVLLYFFSFLDRVSIGNARLFGLEKDLELKASEINWAISVFFMTYVLFEVPSNLILIKFGLPKWIGFSMFAWGTIMMSMAGVSNFGGLLVARLFLGAAEAGLFPGVVFYLSIWYTRSDRIFRMGLFFCGSILAGAFGGLLAYGIGQLGSPGGLAGWQWIFLAEGAPTIFLGIIIYIHLSTGPENTKWLTDDEQNMLQQHLNNDEQIDDDDSKTWELFLRAITDLKVWLFMLINFGALSSVFVFSVFLPSIIHNMNYTDVSAQLMTVPPYTASGLMSLFGLWNSTRTHEHGYHMMIFILIGIGGFLYLIRAKQLLYIGACIASVGIFGTYVLFPSWLTNSFTGLRYRAIVVGLVASAGSIGGILGGQIYRESDQPYFIKGHSIMLGILCVTLALVFILKILITRRGRDYYHL